MTIPIAPIAGILGMEAVGKIVTDVTTNRFYDIPVHLKQMVGITSKGDFYLPLLIRNVLPPVMGLIVHKVVGGKLGLNRMLAQSNVPFIRI